MSSRTIVAAFAVAAACVLQPRAGGAQAPAQAPAPNRVTGSVEVGGRSYINDLSSQERGKFEEYKSVPSGATLQAIRLLFTSPDGFRTAQIVGRDVGERDQSMWLGIKQPGLFNVLLQWDRVPHTYSTTAHMLGALTSPNVLTLPSPRPDTATINASLVTGPIRTLWSPVRLTATLTPNPDWDFKAEFTQIDKSGQRPLGMAFGSPGSNHREIIEPLDQTVRDVKLTESYMKDRYQLLLVYDYSAFDNAFSSVTADNPLRDTNSPTAGAASGRSALPPANVAHTATFTGGVNLPAHSRVLGTVSYGWRRQNEAFIPITDNAAITSPDFADLPKRLNGDSRTSVVNISGSSRPAGPLSLSARFRSYRYIDHTGTIVLPVSVVNDRSLGEEETAYRFPFSRENADLTATWRLAPETRLIAGYQWERWGRDSLVRNLHRTNERMPRVALDFAGTDWLRLRGTYSRAWRRGSTYGNPLTANENPGLRRVDQADRDRERIDMLAEITPLDQLSFSSRWTVGHDLYPHSAYGLQSDRSAQVGGDVSWIPNDRFSVSFRYSRERYFNRQRSQYRDNTSLDNPSFVWVARNNDYISAVGGEFSAVLVPGRLEGGATFDRSRARLNMNTENPTAPANGTAAQITSATASNFPPIKQTLTPASGYLLYRFTNDWATTLRYTYEGYDQSDFRSDGLQPATGADIFLGNDYLNYSAGILTLTFSYRLRALGVGRSAL